MQQWKIKKQLMKKLRSTCIMMGLWRMEEMESSVAALAPEASVQHFQMSGQMIDSAETLDQLYRENLGVGLEKIKHVFS